MRASNRGGATSSGSGVGGGIPTSTIAASGVSVGVAPTGTMANNGAVTLGTALDGTYSEGIFLAYPAGAIAAGVPAATAVLWTVMSSPTVGVVSNNAYTTGPPTVPTTLVPFVTTGPGAYTGVTTEIGITLNVPANSIGLMGGLKVEAKTRNNNSAGTKTLRFRYSGSGGTAIISVVTSTNTTEWLQGRIYNRITSGTNAQVAYAASMHSNAAWSAGDTDLSVDTTVATSVFISTQLNTATDFAIIASVLAEIVRSS